MENSKRNNVNSNTVFNMLKSVFSIIYPLITFPYIFRVLLTENVGKINFGNSIVSYFSLIASLGVTTYAVRECAKVRNDRGLLSKISSEIFSINIVSTIIAYTSLFVLLVFAKKLESYRVLICIQSSTILFTTLGADWINTAMEDFRYISIRTIAMQIVSLILMFGFVKRPEDYLVYAIISVISSSGANIINIFYRKKFCDTVFTFHMNLDNHLKPILLMFSMMLSQTIYVNSDMTILGLIKGDYEVGLYSTAVKIYTIVNTIVGSVAWVVMPQLSECFSKEDFSEINKLLKYSLNFIIVLGLPCVIGMFVIAKELIIVVAGEEYAQAFMALRILAFALVFSFIGGWIGNMMLLPSGKEIVCLKAGIVSALVNVILNVILMPRFGMNAAALTTAISQVIGMIYSVRYVDSRIKITGIDNVLVGPVIGAFGVCLSSFLCKTVLSSSMLVAFSTIILSVVLYVTVLLIVKNEFFLSFFKH